MRSRRQAIRPTLTIAAATAAIAVALAGASSSYAGTYQVAYEPGGGEAGLERIDSAPWYLVDRTSSEGFRIRPTGNGNQIYPWNDETLYGAWAWRAPAGATISRAALAGVHAENADGQRVRLELWRTPEQRMPGYDDPGTPSWRQRLNADADGPWTNESFTLTPAPATTASYFRAWVYPRRCVVVPDGDPDPPGEDRCLRVNPAGTFARVRSMTFTVDDPSPPDLAPSGLPAANSWTNQAKHQVQLDGSDPQSGIASLTLRHRSRSGTRTVKYGTWKADVRNTTARDPGAPPLAAARSVTKTITLGRGKNTLTPAATNGAVQSGRPMQRTLPAVTVGLDQAPPKIAWPKKVRNGSTVRITDKDAKIASGALAVDGRVIKRCAVGKSSCSAKVKGRAGQTATVTVADRAGNTAESSVEIGSSGSRASSSSSRGGRIRVLNGKAFKTAVGPTAKIDLLASNPTGRPARVQVYRGTRTSGTPVLDRQLCPPGPACSKATATTTVTLEEIGLGAAAESGQHTLTFVQIDANNRKLTKTGQTARLRVTLDRDGPSAISPSPKSRNEGRAKPPKKGRVSPSNWAERVRSRIEVTIGSPAKDRPKGSKTEIRSYTFQLVDATGFGVLAGGKTWTASKKRVERKTYRLPWKAGAAAVVVYATDEFGNVGASRALPIAGGASGARPSRVPQSTDKFVYGIDVQADTRDDPAAPSPVFRDQDIVNQFFPGAPLGGDGPSLPRGVVDASGKAVPMKMLRIVAPIDVWATNANARYRQQVDAFLARARSLDPDGASVELLVSFMPHEYLGANGMKIANVGDKPAEDTGNLKCESKSVVDFAEHGGDPLPAMVKPLPADALSAPTYIETPGNPPTYAPVNPCFVPSVPLYEAYVEQWVREVRNSGWRGKLHLGAWNEPDHENFGTIKMNPGPGATQERTAGQRAAQYWIAANGVLRRSGCDGCEVVAGEFSAATDATMAVMEGFFSELRARGARPTVWGIHNYDDLFPTRRPGFYSKASASKNLQTTTLQTYGRMVEQWMGSRPHELWDTETGVLLQKGNVKKASSALNGTAKQTEPPFTPLAARASVAYEAGQRFGQMRLWSERLTRAVYFQSLPPAAFGQDGFDSALATSNGTGRRPAFCGLLGIPQPKPSKATGGNPAPPTPPWACVTGKGGRGE